MERGQKAGDACWSSRRGQGRPLTSSRPFRDLGASTLAPGGGQGSAGERTRESSPGAGAGGYVARSLSPGLPRLGWKTRVAGAWAERGLMPGY